MQIIRWRSRPHSNTTVTIITTVVVSTLLCGCGTSHNDERQAQVNRGRLASTRLGCDACHEIDGAASTRIRAAAPLRGISGQLLIAGQLANSEINLARWIVDPRAIKPGTAMPNLVVTENEARDIAAYLYSLH